MKNSALLILMSLVSATAFAAEMDSAHLTATGKKAIQNGRHWHQSWVTRGYQCVVRFSRTDAVVASYDKATIAYENETTKLSFKLWEYQAVQTSGNDVAFKKSDTLKALQDVGLCAPYESFTE